MGTLMRKRSGAFQSGLSPQNCNCMQQKGPKQLLAGAARRSRCGPETKPGRTWYPARRKFQIQLTLTASVKQRETAESGRCFPCCLALAADRQSSGFMFSLLLVGRGGRTGEGRQRRRRSGRPSNLELEKTEYDLGMYEIGKVAMNLLRALTSFCCFWL